MKYLCLIYGDETPWPKMPAAEAERWMDQFAAFTGGIKASGHYVGSNRLHPSASARTVRVRDGRISSTDGPFAETKEQLGGYFLIEADDLDEACAIAARIPGALYGAVEVRAIASMS